MERKKKALFLYSELAGYFLACVDALVRNGVEVHLVRFPVNPDAPFRLTINPEIKVYERSELSHGQLVRLIHEIRPDLIYCSGWIDKDYVRSCASVSKRIPVILALDNPWKGSIKQQLTRLGSMYLRRIFTHAWVPGRRQEVYARKLGFTNDQILDGVYSADSELYAGYEGKLRDQRSTVYPHKFLFTGRYVESKGVRELWKAFESLGNTRKDWELICVGTGPLKSMFPVSNMIHDLGFVQPGKMLDVISRAGVFILPSLYEPWGVVLHEMASAGLPVISSTEVGANQLFNSSGKNGIVCKAGSVAALRGAMTRMISKSDDELGAMSAESAVAGASYSPEMWAGRIMGILQ